VGFHSIRLAISRGPEKNLPPESSRLTAWHLQVEGEDIIRPALLLMFQGILFLYFASYCPLFIGRRVDFLMCVLYW
jgi:hypothetical protein